MGAVSDLFSATCFQPLQGKTVGEKVPPESGQAWEGQWRPQGQLEACPSPVAPSWPRVPNHVGRLSSKSCLGASLSDHCSVLIPSARYKTPSTPTNRKKAVKNLSRHFIEFMYPPSTFDSIDRNC